MIPEYYPVRISHMNVRRRFRIRPHAETQTSQPHQSADDTCDLVSFVEPDYQEGDANPDNYKTNDDEHYPPSCHFSSIPGRLYAHILLRPLTASQIVRSWLLLSRSFIASHVSSGVLKLLPVDPPNSRDFITFRTLGQKKPRAEQHGE